MASHNIAIAFLIATVLFTCIQAQEHFVLNLRWPGGICSKGECCFPSSFPQKDDFLVEFLARSNGTGTVPGCNPTRFFYNALKPLLEDLKKYWPSLTCPRDIGFRDWESSWEINGVCTGLSLSDYFSKALALRAKANLLTILNNKGIKPSMEARYKLTNVESAINEGLGARTAVLHCVSVKNSIVRNVRLCVDKTATSFIDCPNQKTSVCAEDVQFLSIPQITMVEDEFVPASSSKNEL